MPRWRVIVSRIGRVSKQFLEDKMVMGSGTVREFIVDSTDKDNGAVAAFRQAAEAVRDEGLHTTPLAVQIYLDELTVIDGYVTARVEWPVPAFFWRAADVLSTETRARLDPVTAAYLIPVIERWSQLGRKIRLVLDDDRREDVQKLCLALLPAVPELGLSDVDRARLYNSLALVAWLGAQPDMILTADRQRALDDVLSTLDALVRATPS